MRRAGAGGGDGLGGALFNDSGTVTITDTTFAGDSTAGGAAGTGGTGGNGIGFGGALFTRNGTLLLTNVTIAGNTATLGGGMFVLTDGAGGEDTATLTLNNTILAGSAGGADDFGTLLLAGGHLALGGANDLIQTNPTSGGFPVSSTIITGQDPLLGPLANNGGPTATMALLPGSPAIDAGSNALVTNPPFPGPPFTDQRGEPRIADGGSGQAIVDLGAYERILLPTTTTVSVSDPSPTLGEAVTFTAIVANTATAATPTGTVAFYIDGQPFGGPVPLVDGAAEQRLGRGAGPGPAHRHRGVHQRRRFRLGDRPARRLLRGPRRDEHLGDDLECVHLVLPGRDLHGDRLRPDHRGRHARRGGGLRGRHDRRGLRGSRT